MFFFGYKKLSACEQRKDNHSVHSEVCLGSSDDDANRFRQKFRSSTLAKIDIVFNALFESFSILFFPPLNYFSPSLFHYVSFFLLFVSLFISIVNPTHVNIQPPIGSYLSDELKTEVVCRSYGARPYSLITWILDGVNVTELR